MTFVCLLNCNINIEHQQPPPERGWHPQRPPAALRGQRPHRHQRLDGHTLPQRRLQRLQGRQLQGKLFLQELGSNMTNHICHSGLGFSSVAMDLRLITIGFETCLNYQNCLKFANKSATESQNL